MLIYKVEKEQSILLGLRQHLQLMSSSVYGVKNTTFTYIKEYIGIYRNMDYSKTLIYQIVYETKCFYVGATTNFTRRKHQHKNRCNDKNDQHHNLKIYTFMRLNGWNGSFEKMGWDMFLIEAYPCKTKQESSAREFHHYSLLNPSLNTQVPSRTREQYSTAVGNVKKMCCHHCDKEMYSRNLRRHINTCKKRPTEPNDCIQVVSQVSEPLTLPLYDAVLQSDLV